MVLLQQGVALDTASERCGVSVCREHLSYAHRPPRFNGLGHRAQLRAPEEFGDADLVATIGDLVGQGSVGVLGRDSAMDGQPRSSLMFCLIESEVTVFEHRCPGRLKLFKSRYGLRGVRVGEASHPGPAQNRSPEDILSIWKLC